MKNKVYIAGLVLISALTFSCSNDEESFESQEVKANALKSVPQSVLIKEPIDSTQVNPTMNMAQPEGDPSIPRPPR
jgi:PBP1b-binding outer membrane lipoprotein LpoB